MKQNQYERIPVDEIKVSDRRREDFGDIEELAESIAKYNLIQPIVVDGENNLVAGERRLRACRSLGWADIPVRVYSDLSDDERAEIELEENVRRKDFTPYELSKNLVKLAETAGKVLRSEAAEKSKGFLSNADKNPKGGRPAKPDSETRIAERIGVSQPAINYARSHVSAVARYPELEQIPTQKDALTVAKNLDRLPENERQQARTKLARSDPATLAALAEKPPMPARTSEPKKTPAVRWTEGIYETQKIFTSVGMLGGIRQLTRSWTLRERTAYYERVCEFLNELTQWKEELEEVLNAEQDGQENVA